MRKIFFIVFLFTFNTALANEVAKNLSQKNGCFACHSVKVKVLGPSFVDVSKKYNSHQDARQMLIEKIKNGGSGNWGNVPMISHPNLSDKDIGVMVDWILEL